jgi:hypothetical protein
MTTYLEFIAWIALFFWAALYISIQLDRLNADHFSRAVAKVQNGLLSSSGALRIFGLIIYSPYLMPVRSAIAWAMAAAFLLFL